MPALASNVRSLLHGFTLRAAKFSRRHRTRTNRMRALLALFGCHSCVSFQRLPETSLIEPQPGVPGHQVKGVYRGWQLGRLPLRRLRSFAFSGILGGVSE